MPTFDYVVDGGTRRGDQAAPASWQPATDMRPVDLDSGIQP
jgi:hypothetical protein